ncbi:type 1 glutamine amidotransferase domain-containing protein [Halosimplex pelagicum]|uniref:Type 1 glutamine amidotransferase n=1 Tax=Halosimplex pelagicum TaxID=869886 RepID=A0A7D5T5C1_9EURY|nr:type 1 glutamine amidotransferase domain-containing protein [Halosimplex pelagicum]QLH83311.1 type 1 glutamine amidotransferase [Halosimplex pelagicum]
MSQTQPQDLDGTTVAVLVAPEGTERVEFERPVEALTEAGAEVDVVSIEDGEAQTVDNDLEQAETVEIDETVGNVSAEDYDAVHVPGGTVGADRLRADDDAVAFVGEHLAADKPTGSICHGPWTLVESGAVEGRTLTSYPSLETDVENAGGEWVDEAVVTDDGLVTSRKPDDLDAYCDELVATIATAS